MKEQHGYIGLLLARLNIPKRHTFGIVHKDQIMKALQVSRVSRGRERTQYTHIIFTYILLCMYVPISHLNSQKYAH